MSLSLRLRAGRVVEALFETDGPWSAIRAGQAVSRLVTGLGLREICQLSAEDVLAATGGLPKGEEGCAAWAADVLHGAARALLEPA